ncbi:MAG: site-2 protease family protein [Planctomycetaceae bacterium]
MYATNTILTFSFPLGQFGPTRVRVSFLLPVVVLAIMWRLGNVPLGLLAGAILIGSVVAHEMAHLLVARGWGGGPDTILLWPLGGLQEYSLVGDFRVRVQTILAGPFANLVILGCCYFPLNADGVLDSLLVPVRGFPLISGESVGMTACRMAFFANWILLLVNLLPLLPFDGGLLLRAFLRERFADVEVRDVMVRLGLVLSLFGLLSAFVFDVSSVVALSAFVLVLHLHEMVRWQEVTGYGDTFEGYDFSEEYEYQDAALDDDESFDREGVDEIAKASQAARRYVRHEEERERREFERQQQEEKRVDEILQKLHDHGRHALNAAELRLLKKAGDRYRSRGQHH